MKYRYAGLACLALAAWAGSLGSGLGAFDVTAAAQAGAAGVVPVFEVDPLWPKPLPNHWVLGSVIGLSTDAQDHVWILHKPQSVEDNFKGAAATPPIADCCVPAPPVLEFDPAGNLVGHWGGPGQGYEWPEAIHGITVDQKGTVWIGGNGDKDTRVMRFTRSGQFLSQIGHQGTHSGSNDTENLWRAAGIFVDTEANEAYVADGYGNRRVIVFDADTGAYKRHWGAYGAKPDDAPVGAYDPAKPPSKQFNVVHCAKLSKDGFLYVCDRVNDRVQVFRKDGTFVKEAFFDTKTLGSGSVWDIAFSRDPQETYLYITDGVNEKVRIVRRSTLEVVGSFGDGGRQPGQFYGVHNIATDSKGNVYTTETYTGARLQRFVYKGAVVNAQTPVSKDSLPTHITQLTDFGQRPEWSVDGKQIYFIDKCYDGGEVWIVDVATKKTRQLTKPEDRPKGHFYYRVLALPNGDLLLSAGSARQMNYFQVMEKSLQNPPYNIDAEVLVEGPAVSRKSMKIAWTLPGQLEMYTGEIAYSNGRARIVNRKYLVGIKDIVPFGGADFRDIIETQNWRPPSEDELTFALYRRDEDRTKWGRSSSGSGIIEKEVFGISLKTGKLVNYTTPKDVEGEPEGVFPDGTSTLMESRGEVYRLKLDGTGTDNERLTDGMRATNPAVHDDGNTFVFMTRTCTGLFLFDIKKFEQTKQAK